MSRYQPAGSYSETVLYKGITTANGAGDGSTLIDTVLIAANDFLTDTTIIIQSGVCRRETREISTFTPASGTITVGTVFSAQIVSGVTFAIVGRLTGDFEVDQLQADVGDASASTLGSLYGILGNPSASIDTTILNGIDNRTNNPTLHGLLGIPDNANDTAYRFLLDTIFHDNFDDESLSTTLWDSATVTGSTTVTESSSAPDTLRIQNGGAGTAGTGTLPTILTFNRNLSIRTKIELFRGSLAADSERCDASVRLYKDASDYIYFGPYRDTSETENNRARVVSNVGGAGAVTTDVDTAIEDGIAREYRIDVTEENIYFYIDDIIVHSLKDTTLLNYVIQLYATTQSNTDIIDVRFDYAKVNRISNDYREIYKKLLQIQGGTDSIGTIVNALNNSLDLNYIRSSTTADGTEQTIYANTSIRPFIFRNVNIDLSNMAAGDTTIIKKYAMIDGTNYRLIQSTTYSGAQTLTGIIVSGNEGGVTGVKITIQQTAGTNRSYPWTYYDEAA